MMGGPRAEPIAPPKEAPKKMPAGEPPLKTAAPLQLDVTPVVAPSAEPESKIPF